MTAYDLKKALDFAISQGHGNAEIIPKYMGKRAGEDRDIAVDIVILTSTIDVVGVKTAFNIIFW